MSTTVTVFAGGAERPIAGTALTRGGEDPVDVWVYRRPSQGLPRTVMHAPWGEAVLTDGCRTVTMRGTAWARTFVQRDVPVADAFSRVRDGATAKEWGIATTGGKWQHVGGADPDDYTVPEQGRGQINVTTANISRHCFLGSYHLTNQTVRAAFTTDRAATIKGGLSYGVCWCRGDSKNHYRAKVTLTSRHIVDAFERTVTDGWGTTDSGQAWTTSGGPAGDYSVADGKATLVMSESNSSRRAVCSSASDAAVAVTVSPSVVATGGTYTAALLLRYLSANNNYIARLEYQVDQGVSLRLQKTVGGTVTDLTSPVTVPGGSYTAGSTWRIKAQLAGSTLQAKAWRTGVIEPSGWLAQATDTDVTGAGNIGCRAYAFTSNSNSSPAVTFDDLDATIESGQDRVTLTIQTDVDGALTDLVSTTMPAAKLSATPGSYIYVEGRSIGSTLEARAWAYDAPRPSGPNATTTDTTYTEGRSGLFAFISPGEPVAAQVSVKDFWATGTVVAPAQVRTDRRVYTVTDKHGGSVDLAWVSSHLRYPPQDAIDISMAYLGGAPDIYDGSRRIRGDAHYGPRNPDGSLIEGSDFNDYTAQTWYYTDGSDPNEANQVGSLDCSGLVRMVYGPLGMGIPTGRTSTNDGDVLPRQSFAIVAPDGPGQVVVPHLGVTPTDLSQMQVGDIPGFDADSGEAAAGQIDHVGIYIGDEVLTNNPVFISARKTIDGPTFSASAGSSALVGTGLYATRLRTIKRL